MEKIQNLSLELLEATTEMIKASRAGDVEACINLRERINMINAEINKVMDTYKISC